MEFGARVAGACGGRELLGEVLGAEVGEAGEEHAERWEDAHTVAAGIRVPRAVGDFLILRAVRESGGKAVGVGDPAILAAVDDCAKKDGLLRCPEGGATLAASTPSSAMSMTLE